MKMIEVFANGYKEKAMYDTLAQFTKRVRAYGDSFTMKKLEEKGVSQLDIREELEKGWIKYESRIGYYGGSGYSLTSSGIKLIYSMIKHNR